jgi:RimJ/RimL family protein N-acetyltransferase
LTETPPGYSDRLVTAADASFVVALHIAPHARPHVPAPTEQRVRESIDEPDRERRIVLRSDGTPVGFWALRVHAEGWLIELNRILALAPRHGIGRWALRRMLDRAFDDLGAHRVYLLVTADNIAARALYEREGLVFEGTHRDGHRDDATGAYKDLAQYALLARERR